jgi:hypothetical protein
MYCIQGPYLRLQPDILFMCERWILQFGYRLISHHEMDRREVLVETKGWAPTKFSFSSCSGAVY